MRTAIESEARRIGATVVSTYPTDHAAIHFSTSAGTDSQQGRLWTEAIDATHYEALSRAVKKNSGYDRETGLWVKRASQPDFDAYRAKKKKALSELVERNRKYALEVLGGRVPDEKG